MLPPSNADPKSGAIFPLAVIIRGATNSSNSDALRNRLYRLTCRVCDRLWIRGNILTRLIGEVFRKLQTLTLVMGTNALAIGFCRNFGQSFEHQSPNGLAMF